MREKNYTDNDVIVAVQTSTSIRQVLLKLNIKEAGGNYKTIKQIIKYLKLDISHFTGQASNKGKQFYCKRDVDKYLSNEFPIHSYKLKNRLIKEGIFNAICSSCKLDEWLGKPIALELDHINGNSSNNNLDNLRLLCPNCHAQTDTYRGKNIGKNI